jgi:hypothetical protein
LLFLDHTIAVTTAPTTGSTCEDDLWLCIDEVTENAFSLFQNKISK